jgi:hypothetical protein
MKYKEFTDLDPLLDDFKNCNYVFASAFEENEMINSPIKNALELGVYSLKRVREHEYDLLGQSTKTLYILHKYFPQLTKVISLDVDDCNDTIDRCCKWIKDRGLQVPDINFLQCRSLDFEIEKHFPLGVDFIFLDTSHDDSFPEKIGYKDSGGAGMTYREISYFAPHLSRNGRLFIHDTNNYYVEKSYGNNTAGAIERFITENVGYYSLEHSPNQHGLGEIIRKDSDLYARRKLN